LPSLLQVASGYPDCGGSNRKREESGEHLAREPNNAYQPPNLLGRALRTKRFHRQISGLRYVPRMPLPRVQPIIPVSSREPFGDPDWLFEFKYDGFRALCYIEAARCRFISRRGKMMSRFAALADQVAAELKVNDAILDGEVIESDETGRPQFYDLLRRARAPSYVAFDLLWLNGTDLRSLP
jgi:ATP-dependent DNA ligase